MNPQPYNSLGQLDLMALAIWREARGEESLAKLGVGWVIKNRSEHPWWWGTTVHSVVLKPWQFSSFNHGDPNESKWPEENDAAWNDSLVAAAQALFEQKPDPTSGATSYYDVSIDPPRWAVDGSNELTLQAGRLRFYRLVEKKAEQTAT